MEKYVFMEMETELSRATFHQIEVPIMQKLFFATTNEMGILCQRILNHENWHGIISRCVQKINTVHYMGNDGYPSYSYFHDWMLQAILVSESDEKIMWLFEYSLAKLPKGIFDPHVLIEFLLMYFPYHKIFEMFVDFCSETFERAHFLQSQICTYVIKDHDPKFQYLEKMGYDCYATMCLVDGDKWDVLYSLAFKDIPENWPGVKNPIRLKWSKK